MDSACYPVKSRPVSDVQFLKSKRGLGWHEVRNWNWKIEKLSSNTFQLLDFSNYSFEPLGFIEQLKIIRCELRMNVVDLWRLVIFTISCLKCVLRGNPKFWWNTKYRICCSYVDSHCTYLFGLYPNLETHKSRNSFYVNKVVDNILMKKTWVGRSEGQE